MKLDIECIRDLMMELENNLELDDDLCFMRISLDKILKFEKMKKYSREDVFYTIYNLNNIEYIDAAIKYADNSVYYCAVDNITYRGHEFIQNINSDTIWEKVKDHLKKVGAISIPLIFETAQKIIAARL